MGIESPHLVPVKWCRHKQGQSPAVLGVKPAVEDADAGGFLAFLPAIVESQIEPNNPSCMGLKFQVKLRTSQLIGDDGHDQETNSKR